MPHLLPLLLPLVVAFALFLALVSFFSVKMFSRFFCCGVCRVSDDVENGPRVADESQAQAKTAAPAKDDPKAGAIGVRRFQWPEIESLTARFTSPVIGQGGSSTVYLARLPSSAAAVKVHHPSERLHRAFRQELEVLLHVPSHPHIVPLLGYCDEREEGVLVFEFVPNGSLHEKLQSGDEAILPWSRRMVIAYKLAQALDFLHESCDLQIIHGDIKASNVLLDEQLEPKLCDFGFARMGFSAAVRPSHPMMGSPGYVDPHYLRSGLASKKNDIYSFGVLLLELVTGKAAFCSEKEQMLTAAVGPALKDIPARGLAGLVDPRLGGAYDAAEASEVAGLAASCIGANPSLRPSMAEVVRIIGEAASSSISAISSESDGKAKAAL